jgi:uncharacterized membrane protein YbhN (UPF0104 family)
MADRNGLRLGRPRDWLTGGLLLVGVLIAVELSLGWKTLLQPWSTLPLSMLAGAFALTALSYLTRAVRVQVYFRETLRHRFPAVVRLSILHNTANNLLPMRAGEMVFPWLMRRYFGHGFWSAGASLVWIRLLDLHFLGVIGLVASWLSRPSLWWVAVALGWLGALPAFWWIARRPAVRVQTPGYLGRLLRLCADAAPASFVRLAWLYLWTALSWVLKFVAFAFVLGHFLTMEIWKVIFGVMGAELSTVLPFNGIAGSGSYELAMIAALALFGVAPTAALGVAVNLHLFLLGSTLLLGGIALLIPVGNRHRTGDGDVRSRSSQPGVVAGTAG